MSTKNSMARGVTLVPMVLTKHMLDAFVKKATKTHASGWTLLESETSVVIFSTKGFGVFWRMSRCSGAWVWYRDEHEQLSRLGGVLNFRCEKGLSSTALSSQHNCSRAKPRRGRNASGSRYGHGEALVGRCASLIDCLAGTFTPHLGGTADFGEVTSVNLP